MQTKPDTIIIPVDTNVIIASGSFCKHSDATPVTIANAKEISDV